MIGDRDLKHIFSENLSVTVFLLEEKSVAEFDIYHANAIGTFRVNQMISDTEIELSYMLENKLQFSKKVSYVLYTISNRKVYICQATYSSEYNNDSCQIYSFDIISPLQEIQRRMYQRIACRDEILYQEVTLLSDENDLSEEITKSKMQSLSLEKNGTMVDISGGGIRFVASESIPVGSNLVMRILLDRTKERYIYVSGKIVYSEELKNEQNHYDIRMKYVHIEEQEKEEIVQYAFLLERESQQKKY